MIFIQGQALDNTSDDPFVLDGALLSGNDNRVQIALTRSSTVQRSGRRNLFGATEITEYGDLASLAIRTGQIDTRGRQSPMLVTFSKNEAADRGVQMLVSCVAGGASMIGRSFDESALIADLEMWEASPKVRRGPASWCRALWRWLARIFRGRFGAR